MCTPLGYRIVPKGLEKKASSENMKKLVTSDSSLDPIIPLEERSPELSKRHKN